MTEPALEAIRAPTGLPGRTWSSALSTRPAPPFVYRAFKIGDLVTAQLVLGAAFLIVNSDRLPRGVTEFLALRFTVEKFLLLCVLALIWNRAFTGLELYRRLRIGAHREDLTRIAAACSLGTLPVLLFPLFSKTKSFTVLTVLLFWALSIPAIIGVRKTIRVLGTFLSRQRRWDVLIVGSGPRAQALGRGLRGPDGVSAGLVGFMDAQDRATADVVQQRWLGSLGDLEAVLMRRVVDEVLITLPIKSCYQEIQDTIHTCERLGVQSTYLADIFEPSRGRVGYEHATIRTVKMVQDDFRLTIKRAIDILGAALGLVVLAPLMLVVVGTIKLTSSGPVFFVQQRYGLNKRLFRMYKLRTMVPDAEALQPALEEKNEAQGPVFKIAQDPRVTWIGRLLRKRSFDELPQLWNVLRGEMSLVGPRPLPMRDVGRFEEGWLMRRFSMRPGLTCLWQISGRSEVGFERWVELDLQYIDSWSLWLDWDILLRTIPAVLAGRGAA